MNKRNLEERVDELHTNIDQMVDYIQLKLADRAWHSVANAANDIREYEHEIKVLTELIAETIINTPVKGPKVTQ